MTTRLRRSVPIAARLSLVLTAAIVIVACSAGGPADPSSAATSVPAPTATASSMPTTTATPVADTSLDPVASGGSSPEPSVAPPVLAQAWATADLTDVATGETFRLADLAGRPILIETMAIWCPKCLDQQGVVHEALEELGGDGLELVVIDVDPSETAEALAEYRERHGFAGRYVVAGAEVARALAAEFGDNILNPPATPIVFVGTDGRVTLTGYGPKSRADLVASAREHGA